MEVRSLFLSKNRDFQKKIAQIQTEWRQYATIVLENVRRNHHG